MSFPAWRIFIGAILFFLIANLIFLDWVILDQGKISPSSSPVPATVDQAQISDLVNQLIDDQLDQELTSPDGSSQCDALCRRYFDTQLSQAIATISGTTVERVETVVEKQTTVTSPNPSTSGTFYIPVGGSGTTTNQTWTDTTAEVIINWDNYQGSKQTVTWEGYVKLKDGNGLASARLYDVTHQVAVPGSELETSHWDYQYIATGPLTIWSGHVTYRVQLKTLTGYQASYEGGKIKIILE